MEHSITENIQIPNNGINMEKVDQFLQDQLAKGVNIENIEAPKVNDVINNKQDAELFVAENTNEAANDVEELIDEIIKEVDPKKFKKISWWASLPRKERFIPGDIVYDTSIDHFGIFVEPAKKEGLVKLRLFKLHTKFDVYTRDWYLEFDNIQLVKKGKQIKRGFAENKDEFILKGRNTIKIKEEKNIG